MKEIIVDAKVLRQTPLAEGGEGVIHDLNGEILKVYKPSVAIGEKERKVKLLLSKTLPSNVVAPSGLAVDSKGKFIGYVMPRVSGDNVKSLSNKKYVQVHGVTGNNLFTLVTRIRDTLAALHNNNIVISDLSDSNILFDNKYVPYFIDTDSWTIDGIYCTVCMETFKDPSMKSNAFTRETDYFSFAILLFKVLTRLHPFGGTTSPDMDILTRMRKHLSVIGNTAVSVPPFVNKWDFMSPALLSDMKDIFDKDKRFLIGDSLTDMAANLKLCSKHGDYYYSKFSSCPICDAKATVIIQVPIKVVMGAGEAPYITLVSFNDAKTILALNSYLDINGYIVHTSSGKRIKYVPGKRYYYSNDGENLFTISDESIVVENGKGRFEFSKINSSYVQFNDRELYFLSRNYNLTRLRVSDIGNSLEPIAKTSFNAMFEVAKNGKFLVCNVYDGFKVVNVNGYNYKLEDGCKVVNYGIHYDEHDDQWLLIIEDDKNRFLTYIFKGNDLLFHSSTVRYAVDLDSLCFSAKVIYSAEDRIIKGFNPFTNTYKDFPCKGISYGAKLSREGRQFVAINDKDIIKVG